MKTKCQNGASFLVLAAICAVAVAGCSSPPHSQYRTIHEAVINGDYEAVKADLKAQPADLELPDDSGQMPLHLAAIHCRTNIISLLLDQGAKIDAKMTGGATPLHLAAQSGCMDGVAILLAHHSQVNARDDQGRTPLVRAQQWHQDAVARYLQTHGGTE
jgi:ankyrin repeat protein